MNKDMNIQTHKQKDKNYKPDGVYFRTPTNFTVNTLKFKLNIYHGVIPLNDANGIANSEHQTQYAAWFCLFVWFLFKVPVNNFSVMLRQSHLFLGITSAFGE